ncbi:unnamed protein product [Closterium sp. Yama58-4]|nr:unnamed protein product [Closterium sp. Yama58-4]
MNARVSNLWEFFVTLQYLVTMGNDDINDAMERLEMLQADYSQRAALAFWVLLHSVSVTIQLQLDMFEESYSPAYEAWEYLMDTYQAKDSVVKVSLMKQLDNLKMGSQERVEEYVNRATKIRDKLGLVGKMVDEDTFTLNLLTKLPAHWEEMRHSEMLHNVMDSFTLQRIMIQEQRYHDLITKADRDRRPPRMAGQAHGDRSPSPTAKGSSKKEGFGEKTHGKEGGADRSPLVCWYCKEPGHPFFKCTKAPPGWSPLGWKPHTSRMSKLHIGNSRSFSPQRSRNPKRDNNASLQQGVVGGDNQRTVTCIATVQSSQATLPSARGSSWLLDSGCSQHMTSDERWFEELKELDEPVYVELADGSHLSSTMTGMIRATSSDGTTVRYTEVLYVPGLKNNLLFFCQLLKKGAHINTFADGKTEITMFDGDECVRIGLGKDVHGVLMVKDEPTLTSAHDPGHSRDGASSKKHGREGGTPLCTPGVHLDAHGSILFPTPGTHSACRMALKACVVRNSARKVHTNIESPRSFADMLLDAGSLLNHQHHDDEVTPHIAVWTSGGEG